MDSERDTTVTDKILYNAALTNELDEIDLTVSRTREEERRVWKEG